LQRKQEELIVIASRQFGEYYIWQYFTSAEDPGKAVSQWVMLYKGSRES
jgi:hypothetical protein